MYSHTVESTRVNFLNMKTAGLHGDTLTPWLLKALIELKFILIIHDQCWLGDTRENPNASLKGLNLWHYHH